MVNCVMINYEDISKLIKNGNSIQLIIANNILTYVKEKHKNRNKRNNTKVRNFVILLFANFSSINPVQNWSESHNYGEIKCHTM